MDNNTQLTITNELLLALLNQMYSMELMLADVYNEKANLRYSNAILEKDKQILDSFTELMNNMVKKDKTDGDRAAL